VRGSVLRKSPLVALAVLLLAACGGPSKPAAPTSTHVKNGGVLTIALDEEPDALDPTTAQTLVGREVFANFCEKLYDINSKLQIVPQLAASLPQVSDGGLTVTIKLRHGILFNDGTSFNADAVKTTLERDLTLPTSARKSEISPVENVTVTGPYTVQLTLSHPFAPLTAALADRAGMIMSPTQLQKLGTNFASDPVCVGPFEFSKRIPGDEIVLTKSPYYYAKDKVHLSEIVYKFIGDDNVRLANVESGAVQIGDQMAPTDVQKIQSDPNLKLYQSTSIGYQGIDINIGNANGEGKPPGPVDNPFARSQDLRQAFAAAINRSVLNNVVFDGRFVPSCSPIAPVSPYYDASFKCPPYDPAQARRLIKESGVTTPIPVTMLVPNETVPLRQAQVIQQMVDQVGFQMTIQSEEFVTSLDQADAGHYEMYQVGWSGRIDPDQNIYQFWHTDGSLNATGSSDPQLDKLLDEARTTNSFNQRKQLYAQILQLINQQDSIIVLYNPVNYMAVSKKLVGVQYYADGIPRVAFAGYVS
jgi:peptide/nickel transport system substrate-binding protein